MAKDFFANLREHTEIKLRILAKYLVPWCAKLGSISRSLWYVDGFAGPGRYNDGNPGSPVIGAEQAVRVQEAGHRYVLGCINVEVKQRLYQQLCQETKQFVPHVPIKNLQGDFSDLIPEIIEIIGNDPVLIFLDPFGIRPLKFNKLVPLIGRAGRTDLILTFQSPAVLRLATDHPHLITEAIGSANWQQTWDRDGVNSVLDEFADNLSRSGRFLGVALYAIRATAKATSKYHLLFASRHYDSYELLNDFVAHEETQLTQKTYSELPTGQFTFLPHVETHQRATELLQLIRQYGAQHPRTTRQAIVQYFVTNQWAQFTTTEIKGAVKALIDADEISRQRQGRGQIDSDPLQFA